MWIIRFCYHKKISVMQECWSFTLYICFLLFWKNYKKTHKEMQQWLRNWKNGRRILVTSVVSKPARSFCPACFYNLCTKISAFVISVFFCINHICSQSLTISPVFLLFFFLLSTWFSIHPAGGYKNKNISSIKAWPPMSLMVSFIYG